MLDERCAGYSIAIVGLLANYCWQESQKKIIIGFYSPTSLLAEIASTMLLLILQITSCCKSFQSDFIDIKKNSPAEKCSIPDSKLSSETLFFCHRTARSYNYIYKGTALSATKHISKTFWADLTSAPTVSIVTKKQ